MEKNREQQNNFFHSIEHLLSPEGIDALKLVAREASPPNNTGEIYQVRFEESLGQLKNENKIIAWEATEQYSEADRNGIDYWITDPSGERIPFQIKGRLISHHRRRVRELRERGIVVIIMVSSKSKKIRTIDFLKHQIIDGIEKKTSPNAASNKISSES